jgi:hypothetical protein
MLQRMLQPMLYGITYQELRHMSRQRSKHFHHSSGRTHLVEAEEAQGKRIQQISAVVAPEAGWPQF